MDAKVITVLNRLSAKDSITGIDVWFKTKLYDVVYAKKMIANVVNTTTSLGEIYNILIPFGKGYIPYNEWKSELDKNNKFTISQGDIILIDVDLDEDVSANSIVAIRNKYKQNACEVRTVEEVKYRFGVKYQLKVGGV